MFVRTRAAKDGGRLPGEGRMPLMKVISGDSCSIVAELKAPSGAPATPKNSKVEFVLSENQFSPPLWTGTWFSGVLPDGSHPGLVRIEVPRELTKSLRRGSYMFSIRVSDQTGWEFRTQRFGYVLVEYAPTSDQRSIPYRDGTSDIFSGGQPGGSNRPGGDSGGEGLHPSAGAPVYGTTLEWLANSGFVPKEGQVVIWMDHGHVTSPSGERVPVPGVKVGDGVTPNVSLPFVGDDVAEGIVEAAEEKYVRKEAGKGLVAVDPTLSIRGDAADAEATGLAISAKQDAIPDLSDIRSGASAGATAYQKPSGGIPGSDLSEAVRASLGKADTALQDGALDDYFNAASYDPIAREILLKHGDVVKARISAAPFLKDGMVEDVTFSNGNLSIAFNADAGKNPIVVPIGGGGGGGDLSNYYTKAEADARFVEQEAGKGLLAIDATLSVQGDAADAKATGDALAGKQATISDLSDIRSGAAAGSTAYQLPVGGIPSTDLSFSVRTSLGKADTALQDGALDDYYTKSEADSAFVEKEAGKGLVAVDSTLSVQGDAADAKAVGDALANKQATINDLSDIRSGAAAGSTAYQKPVTGIPETDLSEAVQTSLGKADTALQEHQSLANYYTKTQTDEKFVEKAAGKGLVAVDATLSVQGDAADAKATGDALAGKQATIDDLSAIRSGAAAGATAYQLPSGGVPSTDLSSAVQASLGKADTALQEHQSLDAYFNAASYDSGTKKILLKHDDTTKAEIDAMAFIKDGMVSNVQILNGNLVITFNTDAGKDPISIPLTDIFNPSNYYDKTAADAKFVEKEAGKGLVAVDATLSVQGDAADAKAVGDALAGKAASDHSHSGVYKPVQSPVSSPSASGTATEFIDTVSQNANGEITATKKGIATTAPSQSAQTGQVADAKATSDAIDALKSYVDNLFNYKAITASLSISSSTPAPGAGESQTVREKGRTVTSVTFGYSFSKVPIEAKFGDTNPPTEVLSDPGTSGSITKGSAESPLSITSAKTWRISGKEAEVPGKTQQTATASVTVNFYNGVYFAAAAEPASVDSAFILGMANKRLQSSRVASFTVTAGEGQYIWYALPTSMGACAFKVGGFDGGFMLADTISFTNSLGHTESYYVYRSDNPNLGNTTVNVAAA